MTRDRKIRLPHRYTLRYGHRTTRENRTFTVSAWNKLDADLDGLRQLQAMGENPDDWWAYGAEREK